MYKFIFLALLSCPIFGQHLRAATTFPPATQAEVDAGLLRTKFVSPLTLANYSGGVAGGLSNGYVFATAAFTTVNVTNIHFKDGAIITNITVYTTLTTPNSVFQGTNGYFYINSDVESNRFRIVSTTNLVTVTNALLRYWEVRTNLYDIEADLYFTRAGVTNLNARWRIDGFIKSMKAAGLWDEVIDGATYYPEQQRPTLGSNYSSFKSVDTVITTNKPTQMVHGLAIATGIDFVGYSMNDWRTGSVAVVVRASTNTTFGSIAWMANNSASSQHEIGAYWPVDQYMVGFTKWNDDAENSPLFWYGPGTQGAYIQDPHRHTCLLTTDGNGTMNTYTDGITSFTNTAMTIVSNTLTRFTIGTRGGYGSYEVPGGKFAVGAWLRFNRVLTATEAAQLEMCMMWLEDADEHWIVEGDSMSYQHEGSTESLNNWPLQLYMMGHSNRVVIHNVAYTGEAASTMVGQTSQWLKYRPGQFGILASRIFVAAGVNDIYFNDTADNAFANSMTLWRTARENGFKVTAFTIPQSLSYEAVDLPHWTNFNALIVSNAWAYDGLVRRDLLYPKTNTVDFLADGLHFNATGYRKVADAVASSLSGGNPRLWLDNMIIGGDARLPANVFGSIWGDYDAIAATRGAIKFHDGTTTNVFVAVDATDAPATGNVPTVQSDGRLTWETPSSGSGTPGGLNQHIQFNQGSAFDGTNDFYFDRTNRIVDVQALTGAETNGGYRVTLEGFPGVFDTFYGLSGLYTIEAFSFHINNNSSPDWVMNQADDFSPGSGNSAPSIGRTNATVRINTSVRFNHEVLLVGGQIRSTNQVYYTNVVGDLSITVGDALIPGVPYSLSLSNDTGAITTPATFRWIKAPTLTSAPSLQDGDYTLFVQIDRVTGYTNAWEEGPTYGLAAGSGVTLSTNAGIITVAASGGLPASPGLGSVLLSDINGNPMWHDPEKLYVRDNFKTVPAGGGTMGGGQAATGNGSASLWTQHPVYFSSSNNLRTGWWQLYTTNSNVMQAALRYGNGNTGTTNFIWGTNSFFDCYLNYECLGDALGYTNTLWHIGFANRAFDAPGSLEYAVAFQIRAARAPLMTTTHYGQGASDYTTNALGNILGTNSVLRLTITGSTNSGIIFWTNGVQAFTHTTDIPIGVKMIPSVYMVGAANTVAPYTTNYLNFDLINFHE